MWNMLQHEKNFLRERDKNKETASNSTKSSKDNTEYSTPPEDIDEQRDIEPEGIDGKPEKPQTSEKPEKTHSHGKLPERSRTLLMKENAAEEERRAMNTMQKLKSRSVTSYPVSERYNDRPPRWHDPHEDESPYNYSNNSSASVRDRKMSDTGFSSAASSRKLSDNTFETGQVQGNLHKSSYIPSTMLMTPPSSGSGRNHDMPQTIKFSESGGIVGLKSKSAKDYRNGISTILNGHRMAEEKRQSQSDKYFEVCCYTISFVYSLILSVEKYTNQRYHIFTFTLYALM